MTTHATMAVPRQPFSPLNSPRLQHLQSGKNRQNGMWTCVFSLWCCLFIVSFHLLSLCPFVSC